MLPEGLASQVADVVGQLHARYTGVVADHLDGTGVTAAQFIALVVLQAFPAGLTQAAWGRHQGVSRQRAHRVARELRELGFVAVRRRGRASTVALTEAGVVFLSAHGPAIDAELARRMPQREAAVRQALEQLAVLLQP